MYITRTTCERETARIAHAADPAHAVWHATKTAVDWWMWERAGVVPTTADDLGRVWSICCTHVADSLRSDVTYLPPDVCRTVFTYAALRLLLHPTSIAHWAFWATPCRDTTALLVDDYISEYNFVPSKDLYLSILLTHDLTSEHLPGSSIPLAFSQWVNAKEGMRTLLNLQVRFLPGTRHPNNPPPSCVLRLHDHDETEDEMLEPPRKPRGVRRVVRH